MAYPVTLPISQATVIQLNFEKLFSWTLLGIFGHIGVQHTTPHYTNISLLHLITLSSLSPLLTSPHLSNGLKLIALDYLSLTNSLSVLRGSMRMPDRTLLQRTLMPPESGENTLFVMLPNKIEGYTAHEIYALSPRGGFTTPDNSNTYYTPSCV